jgi:hypothetical protein
MALETREFFEYFIGVFLAVAVGAALVEKLYYYHDEMINDLTLLFSLKMWLYLL